MKKFALLLLCAVCAVSVSCSFLPASSQPQQSSLVPPQSISQSMPKSEAPSSESVSASSSEALYEEYPIEKITDELVLATKEIITSDDNINFRYCPLPALAPEFGGGSRLYEIGFSGNNLRFAMGFVDSEYIRIYEGNYAIDEGGIITSDMKDVLEQGKDMSIKFKLEYAWYSSSSDKKIVVTMLSCTNAEFEGMLNRPLVYHTEERGVTQSKE